MKIKLIAAVDAEFGIGKNNDLPWHLPADMAFFKEKTQNTVVITGRKNYESIPEKYRPLTNRINIVLSRKEDYIAEGCIVFKSYDDALHALYNGLIPGTKDKEIFVIGGGQLFKEVVLKDKIDEMYITHIEHSFNADVFFPDFDTSKWNYEIIDRQEPDAKNKYPFIIRKYTRK